MKHLGTKQIETERLLLRQFTLDDVQAMFENWASDREVTKYLTWPAHGSPAVTQMVLRDWTEQYIRDDFYQWAVAVKGQSGDLIGSISVVSHDDLTQKAHVGYCIGRPWWRQGIATEALRAVISFLMNEVGVQRIEARHDLRNPNSGAVMRKCGMRREGTLHRSDWNNQGICDAVWYAILSTEMEGETV